MIALLSPQFATQDDNGQGTGIAPISQWVEITMHHQHIIAPSSDMFSMDPAIHDILHRLRMLSDEDGPFELSTTDFHDLVCFVLHRLLDPQMNAQHSATPPSTTSECFRLALALYLLAVHGPTYFSHVRLQYSLMQQLKRHLGNILPSIDAAHSSLTIWLLSIGMVASYDTLDGQDFIRQASRAATVLCVFSWEDVLFHVKEILWFERQQAEHLFRQAWDNVWSATAT